MRKSFVLLLTGLLAVLILSACGQKTQQDIVTGLDEKAKEYTSYKAKAKMTIETGVSLKYTMWKSGTKSRLCTEFI